MGTRWVWLESGCSSRSPEHARSLEDSGEEYSDTTSSSRSHSSVSGASIEAAPHKRKRSLADDRNGPGVDFLRLTDEDIPFILGKGGQKVQKIGKVAGCKVQLQDDSNLLEIQGGVGPRACAKRYLRLLLAQKRGGDIRIRHEVSAGGCTAVPVPSETVGLVLGKHGSHLRKTEDQYNVLMFLASEHPEPESHNSHTTVMILGDRHSRRGAQLAIMSRVETKCPGEFTDGTLHHGRTYDTEEDADWGTCFREFTPDDMAFAIGKRGLTRQKLERSSNCIVQTVHNVVYISGCRADRLRAREYTEWIFDELEGPVSVDTRGRTDVTALDVPRDTVGYIKGRSREALTRIEANWGVHMMFHAEREADRDLTRQLLIFGSARGRVGAMLDAMRQTETVCPGYFSRGVKNRVSERIRLGIERMVLGQDQLPRLLGKGGVMARLIATASGAMVQFVGSVCWAAGTLKERRRCLDYVRWVRDQVSGLLIIDTRGRSDVTEVHLPACCAETVVGSHCEQLRQVERESQCLLLLAYDHQAGRRLCIFSHDGGSRLSESGRAKAERLVNQRIHTQLRLIGSSRELKVEDTDNRLKVEDQDNKESKDWDRVDWDS